jgi:hypothetical protein
MTNAILGSSWAARLTLVCAIACLYAGAVNINNSLLFPWLEYDDFRYLLFLPAGLKLFLVMLFNWRAVLGITIGVAAVSLNEIQDLSLISALMLGTTAGLSTKLTLTVCARLLGIGYPWSQLKWTTLCVLAIAVGCMDALTIHMTLFGLGLDNTDDLLSDVLQGAFGRVAGTFVFLALSLEIRRRLLSEQRA